MNVAVDSVSENNRGWNRDALCVGHLIQHRASPPSPPGACHEWHWRANYQVGSSRSNGRLKMKSFASYRDKISISLSGPEFFFWVSFLHYLITVHDLLVPSWPWPNKIQDLLREITMPNAADAMHDLSKIPSTDSSARRL